MGSTLVAQPEFIETDGLLSDDDFYRLTACGAPPGGDCTKRFSRWPVDQAVTVGIARMDRAFLGGKQKRAHAALARALQYLNDAGMGLTLQLAAEAAQADIRIYFIDTDGAAPISGTGIEGVDGTTVRGARVMVWAERKTGRIDRARIVFGTRLSIRQYESAMLEELTQSLGLLTDIRNPAYEGVSIFSEDSNASKTFGPQDLMVLRRHYPPRE
ncbi:DUF2927 domain-containing protein [Thalassococcus lentus]|uniref:DUF2927 domain-containing protein n=1 Tax=Thalassococcus lentus TaxID=1210524 RepID=A0ABT4XU21_9RHOB|nr:DUF2927 domain-containing protein [Thalassococcus lentus]MDA7425466.1 DUF2927 domain-containing protein [Thalassococcus lentus]